MATATAGAADTTELLLLLSEAGVLPLADLAARVPEAALAVAWARGDIEFGRTKYVVTGNPGTNVTVHNGVHLPPATLVVEGGVEWTGPKQRWHAPYREIKAGEALPACPRYQKYQLEVCVSKERDAWEWLAEGEDAQGRETRYARREVRRDEAERLVGLYVRLSDKGAAALQS